MKIFLFAVTILFLALYASNFLVIKKISCKTQFGPCTQSLSEIFNPLLGKNLFWVNSSRAKELISGRSGILDISLKKKLPGTLIVNVEVSKPVVALLIGQKLYLADLRAEVVGETEESSLPKVILDKSISESEKDELRALIKLLAYLYSLGFESSGEVGEDNLVLRIHRAGIQISGTQVLVSKEADPVLVAGSLHFMLARFTMDGKQPRKIDMRFKNPVVTF